MDTKRARQIMDSTDDIRVLHNGYAVWLESINDNNTAKVTYLDSNKKEIVPLYMLNEDLNPE